MPTLLPMSHRRRTWTRAVGLMLFMAGGFAAAAPTRAADPAPTAGAALPSQLADFDAYIESMRKTFDVPGVAVAVVKDDEIVFERGWGERELGKARVDAHTLFAIASNTKAFTATALNMLAEDGKLNLDDRVIDHLPWFQMADPYVTREMRLRDLLAHRSGLGLGAGDLLYWPTTTYTGEEVARRLRHVPLAGSFRDRYAYDNILYGVAQLVVEQVSGQTFEVFLRTRIFVPLGMTETRYNSDALKPDDNAATGYALADGKDLLPAPQLSWHNVSGAGGIYASAHDMARWMRLQLDGGAYRDAAGAEQRLFPGKNPTTDVVGDHADTGAAAISAGVAGNEAEFHRLRPGLGAVRLPWQETGLAHRRLAGHGLAADTRAGAQTRRGRADECRTRRRLPRHHVARTRCLHERPEDGLERRLPAQRWRNPARKPIQRGRHIKPRGSKPQAPHCRSRLMPVRIVTPGTAMSRFSAKATPCG